MNSVASAHENVRIDYPIITWMVLIHLAALPALWSFSWGHLGLTVFMYFITGCLGITMTYHRLLTHRAFKVPKWLEYILATCGALALQGSPLEWVAHHRMHHAGSDTEIDPHNARRGFLFSHMTWLFYYVPSYDDKKQLRRFARDIAADPYYQFLERMDVQILLQVAVALGLYAIGGWQYMVWGFSFRLVAVYHCTWLVNSAAHIWGYTNYDVSDSSKNNWLVAFLTWGEGWHNNHHAYGGVAEAGHKWWEIDITMMVIRLLKLLGLATDVKSYKDLPSNVTSSSGAATETLADRKDI